MNAYLIQFSMLWEDRSANHAQVREMVEKVMPEAGSMLILPEMFATGFSMNVDCTAQGDSREDEAFIKELAVKWQCVVVAGVVTRHGDGRARNEALVVSADGGEMLRYAKQQMFTPGGEHDVYLAGDEVRVFDFEGFKVAPLVCYDLRFPEHFRKAIDLGAEVLVVIASWPARRQRHWEVLLQARAIENQAFVIGVNRCGSDPNAEYVGGSVVFDPLGQQVVHAGSGPGVTEVWLDRQALLTWRQQFPALSDRKPN
ncbi:carbon-nitrogen family hydrolase [Phragmitibacter flavus]|uniref:Carbon-nitrogen family hydrolase n=1 Tax=Phragmitibacter flavus TaxID=2576071 RepID=A0A5R8KAF5_9BACT|nr:nitrilase-related carbon-nitrogen hydrolase [Phragmitibacter flavus]TLD68519.1 carbon-nitrogen family hydrolase [Phragmitibacter flavus]